MGGGGGFNEGAIGLWPRLALAQGTPPLGTGGSGELGNNPSTANLHPLTNYPELTLPYFSLLIVWQRRPILQNFASAEVNPMYNSTQ